MRSSRVRRPKLKKGTNENAPVLPSFTPHPSLNLIERLQEGDSAPPVSAQMRKETKQSYANLRSLLQKYDKGERRGGEGASEHLTATAFDSKNHRLCNF